MAKWQGRSLKKPSGGRIWASRNKRKREMGSNFIEPKIGKPKNIEMRGHGGAIKLNMLYGDTANVIDPKTGKAKKAKIITVVQNPADQHYVRRNILTKGAIVDTDLGKAKITSRPGQVGVIDAVLIEPKAATS